jgi:hypothetical protein
MLKDTIMATEVLKMVIRLYQKKPGLHKQQHNSFPHARQDVTQDVNVQNIVVIPIA